MGKTKMSDIKQMLDNRMSLSFQRYVDKQINRARTQQKEIATARVIGIDSNFSIDGKPMAVLLNSNGKPVRASVISSGIRSGDSVNIAKPTNSPYGTVSSMPGRY